MSVYKVSRSPYWVYDFQVEGRRFYGSTKCTTRREAKAFERKCVKKARADASAPRKQEVDGPVGLVGFYGHTYVEPADIPGGWDIQFQFRIIRSLPPDRYVVQLFSFIDGSPTELAVYTESFLLGDDVKLYANADLWNAAYAKTARQIEKLQARREASG